MRELTDMEVGAVSGGRVRISVRDNNINVQVQNARNSIDRNHFAYISADQSITQSQSISNDN